LENKQDYAGAIDSYKKALSLLTEEDVNYLINMGRVYTKMGKKNSALDILERALSKAFCHQQKTQVREMIKNL
jgi:tetratricopeptide (TPR) repeat protein